MGKYLKSIFPLTLLIFLFLLSGCSSTSPEETQAPPVATSMASIITTAPNTPTPTETPGSVSEETGKPDEPDENTTETDIPDSATESVPLADEPVVIDLLMPSAAGIEMLANAKAEIDASNKQDGYILVKYLEQVSNKLRLIITGPSGTNYQYVLSANGQYEVFPLSDGNGSYKISVYEGVGGDKYSTAFSDTLRVELTDEFAPFLRPNQYVNYSADNETIKKAQSLTKNSTTILDSIAAVYEYVVGNITYDHELAKSVQSGYLPDIDAVLEKGKGICFDYSAVMAAMLRSQSIPTKLVVGYAGDQKHAWISTYSTETGWINDVIYFDGNEWKLMDPTFASSGGQSDEITKYIGNGKNYTVKNLY